MGVRFEHYCSAFSTPGLIQLGYRSATFPHINVLLRCTPLVQPNCWVYHLQHCHFLYIAYTPSPHHSLLLMYIIKEHCSTLTGIHIYTYYLPALDRRVSLPHELEPPPNTRSKNAFNR